MKKKSKKKFTKAQNELQKLIEICVALRGPSGCPWDIEQTHQSLCPYALEESHELVDAIENGGDIELKEELGDVLFQVALHAQIASERGAFDLSDVVQGLNEKMIYRHPHVFAKTKVSGTKEVIANWEKLKKRENKKTVSPLNVPVALPALQRSMKIGFRAQKLKFDWAGSDEVWEKVHEEFGELKEALQRQDSKEIREELGDLFFSLAQLARHLDMDPEQTARAANQKFEKRFAKMLALCSKEGESFVDLPLTKKEKLWQQVKKLEKKSGSSNKKLKV